MSASLELRLIERNAVAGSRLRNGRINNYDGLGTWHGGVSE